MSRRKQTSFMLTVMTIGVTIGPLFLLYREAAKQETFKEDL